MVKAILPTLRFASNVNEGSSHKASGCKMQNETRIDKADKIIGPMTSEKRVAICTAVMFKNLFMLNEAALSNAYLA